MSMTTQYKRLALIVALFVAALLSPLALTAQTTPGGATTTASSPADTSPRTDTTTRTDVDQPRHHNYGWVGLLGLIGLGGLMRKNRYDDRVEGRADSRRTNV